jgi:S-phase kinase-associated protein 1
MAAGEMPLVTLRSSDGVEFQVAPQVAQMSVFLRNLMAHFPDNDEPIPLEEIEGDVLRLVIQYCSYYIDDRAEDPGWDAEFIRDIDRVTSINLINAANFLEIDGLVNVACQTLANKFIQGWNTQQIFDAFRTVDPPHKFTEEEERAVKVQDEWARVLTAFAGQLNDGDARAFRISAAKAMAAK